LPVDVEPVIIVKPPIKIMLIVAEAATRSSPQIGPC
jgi:hypothetical protein